MDSFSASDVYLRSLANQLGCEWKELATNLRLRSDEIDRICMDYPRTSDRIYAVLIQWRNRLRAGVDADSVLENALKKSGRCDLASKIKDKSPLCNRNVHPHQHILERRPIHTHQGVPVPQPIIFMLQKIPIYTILPVQSYPVNTSYGASPLHPTSAPRISNFTAYRAALRHQPQNAEQLVCYIGALPIQASSGTFMSQFTNYRAATPIHPSAEHQVVGYRAALPIQTSGASHYTTYGPLPNQIPYVSSNHFTNYRAGTLSQPSAAYQVLGYRAALPIQTSDASHFTTYGPLPNQIPHVSSNHFTNYRAGTLSQPSAACQVLGYRAALPIQTSDASHFTTYGPLTTQIPHVS